MPRCSDVCVPTQLSDGEEILLAISFFTLGFYPGGSCGSHFFSCLPELWTICCSTGLFLLYRLSGFVGLSPFGLFLKYDYLNRVCTTNLTLECYWSQMVLAVFSTSAPCPSRRSYGFLERFPCGSETHGLSNLSGRAPGMRFGFSLVLLHPSFTPFWRGYNGIIYS